MKRRGFTLFEAIVVVALLALVAAILFPIFARPRENGPSPEGKCRNTMSGGR
jgi:prepilin-type N-terminal cleavage/methylation domain-containing protein